MLKKFKIIISMSREGSGLIPEAEPVKETVRTRRGNAAWNDIPWSFETSYMKCPARKFDRSIEMQISLPRHPRHSLNDAPTGTRSWGGGGKSGPVHRGAAQVADIEPLPWFSGK
ncbi:MAG: hypothetical protein COV67_00525 [Nitrospinae bacterium CG11_big_fil_rev_8_21_14_0_20_56_8]|nr:MAG: hypothetical protein COV67_00525 [Nitrospinae bacterium CG11_big_fil_rev_8_21_14_0_20_56_8]